MVRLRDLGHPDYLRRIECINCNDELENAKKKVFTCVPG